MSLSLFFSLSSPSSKKKEIKSFLKKNLKLVHFITYKLYLSKVDEKSFGACMQEHWGSFVLFISLLLGQITLNFKVP